MADNLNDPTKGELGSNTDDIKDAAESTPLQNEETVDISNEPTPSMTSKESFDWKHPAVLITGIVLGIGAALGIAVGIYFAVSGPNEVPIKLPDGTEIIGYKGEWTEWETTSCSVSCGDGQQTVQRSCSAKDASLDTVVCDAINGTFESFQFEIVECDNPACTIGRVVVEDTISNLKKSLSSNNINFDDKEFLKRYAESVTEYGNTINADENSGGHGIWRIIDTDAKLILQNANVISRRRRAETLTISKNYVVNLKMMCERDIDPTVLDSDEDFLKLLDEDSCASAAAILTYLTIQDIEIPRDPYEQEKLMQKVSNQQLVSMSDVLAKEAHETQDRCGTTDIDFEFLIDSSGSVGADHWRQTVVSIADGWILGAIKPVYTYGSYGNHVAARQYSTSTARFIDFQQKNFETSGQTDYDKYLSDIMRNAGYRSGGTDTAGGLNQVVNVDLPTSRQLEIGRTIVVVFTDGASNNPADTIVAADKLKNKATVFSVGIGSNLNLEELKAISSSGDVLELKNFDEIDTFVQSIMGSETVCGEYDCANTFRIANPSTMGPKGCSKLTGQDYGCGLQCIIDDPNPKKASAEIARQMKTDKGSNECIDCSHQIASTHIPVLDGMKDNIRNAAKTFGVDEYIIAAFISKMTNAGLDLDDKGYMPCASNIPSTTKCFGVMRVPEDRFDDIVALEQKGVGSQESIEAGIKLLMEIAKCVCESTKLSQRQTQYDIIAINERSIAAYQVGCASVPPSVPFADPPLSNYDMKDFNHYDFSSDIIARAQLFTSQLFL